YVVYFLRLSRKMDYFLFWTYAGQKGHAFRSAGHDNCMAVDQICDCNRSPFNTFIIITGNARRELRFVSIGSDDCRSAVTPKIPSLWINDHKTALTSGVADCAC